VVWLVFACRMDTDIPEYVEYEVPGSGAVLWLFVQHRRPDGLLDRLPSWPFVDWGRDFDFGMRPKDENGGSAIITLQFIEALRYGVEFEMTFGDLSTAEKYRDAASRAAQAVRKLCWNEAQGLLADTPAQQHYS